MNARIKSGCEYGLLLLAFVAGLGVLFVTFVEGLG